MYNRASRRNRHEPVTPEFKTIEEMHRWLKERPSQPVMDTPLMNGLKKLELGCTVLVVIVFLPILAIPLLALFALLLV